jgi:hypothetical protein
LTFIDDFFTLIANYRYTSFTTSAPSWQRPHNGRRMAYACQGHASTRTAQTTRPSNTDITVLFSVLSVSPWRTHELSILSFFPSVAAAVARA